MTESEGEWCEEETETEQLVYQDCPVDTPFAEQLPWHIQGKMYC